MNHAAVRHHPLPGSGGIYHRILNAESRGDLITVCNKLGLTGQAAEVGVFRGHFARHNLELWHGKTYYLIDAWAFRANDTLYGKVSRDKNSLSAADHDVNYGIARARVLPWVENGTAVMIRRFAEAAVLMFPDAFFDFIYIDAGHEFHNVARDMELWWPKLRPGGMFAGDDFADAHDSAYFRPPKGWGVKSAVANFSATVGSPFFLTFAERPRFTRPSKFNDGPEFESDDEAKTRLAQTHGIRKPVRAHAFFPSWYMFK